MSTVRHNKKYNSYVNFVCNVPFVRLALSRVAGATHFLNFRLRLQLQTNFGSGSCSCSCSYPYPYPVLRSRSSFDQLRFQVLLFTGSGSFSYKSRLKSSKKHVFAFTSLHRLRLRPKSTGSGSATLPSSFEKIHSSGFRRLQKQDLVTILHPGLWIRIHFLRIRIQQFF